MSILRGFLGLVAASLSFSLFADAFVWSGGGTANADGCSPVALGANTVTAEPKFRIRKGRHYCLSSGSPCIDAGAPCEWAKESDALDLYGNPRKFGIRQDIGCVESQVGGMLLLVK